MNTNIANNCEINHKASANLPQRVAYHLVCQSFGIPIGITCSKLGASHYAFKQETGDSSFARRRVSTQYLINVTKFPVLPLALPLLVNEGTKLLTLVFTPIALNALIWSQAARFSKQRRISWTRSLLHADDLRLSHQTNLAICQLTHAGKLDGATFG